MNQKAMCWKSANYTPIGLTLGRVISSNDGYVEAAAVSLTGEVIGNAFDLTRKDYRKVIITADGLLLSNTMAKFTGHIRAGLHNVGTNIVFIKTKTGFIWSPLEEYSTALNSFDLLRDTFPETEDETRADIKSALVETDETPLAKFCRKYSWTTPGHLVVANVSI